MRKRERDAFIARLKKLVSFQTGDITSFLFECLFDKDRGTRISIYDPWGYYNDYVRDRINIAQNMVGFYEYEEGSPQDNQYYGLCNHTHNATIRRIAQLFALDPEKFRRFINECGEFGIHELPLEVRLELARGNSQDADDVLQTYGTGKKDAGIRAFY